jgi:hypothetical protein
MMHNDEYVEANHMTLAQALRLSDENKKIAAKDAIVAEIRNVVGCGAFKPVQYSLLSPQEKGAVIPAHMFVTEKKKADGSYDRTKARLVAGGNHIPEGSVGETYAPTINPITVMMIINIAAVFKKELRTYDISGAFLKPEVKDGDKKVHVQLDINLTVLLIEEYPEFAPFRTQGGRIIMELRRYLYGLPQAGHHFNKHLTNSLISMGMRQLRGDKCAFIRGTAVTKIIVGTHVDDVLAMGTPEQLDVFEKEFQSKYAITKQMGEKLSYIGLDIIRLSDLSYIVSQFGYRKEILSKFAADVAKIRCKITTPGTENAIQREEGNYDLVDVNHYLSLVMSLMYLARYTRPDILFMTTYLCSKSNEPNELHYKMACRVLKYIKDTPNYGIRFRNETKYGFELKVYADAGHATYIDGKGQAGIFITLGSGFIFARSTKIKMVTLSSTESEQYALSDATTYVIWCKSIMEDLGFKLLGPVKVYHDNTSAAWMSEHDGAFARNKHILVRRNFIKEQVSLGNMIVLYRDTELMPADMLTKNLNKVKMEAHMKTVHMQASRIVTTDE